MRTYYPQLDGVRAIAVTMVMIFHMAQQGIPLRGPIILGQTGVDLFFVLSGFLITGILLKSSQGDWHEVRTFYVRRTLRIFPLYYAFLLFLLATGHAISPSFWVYLQNIFTAFSTVQGPAHFWSLAVEEQFYLIWPFLVLFLPRKYLTTALGTMIVLAFLCRWPLMHYHISPFYFTLSRIDALAAGSLLAYGEQRGLLRKLRPLLVAILLVSVAVVLIDARLAKGSSGVFWEQMTKFSAFAGMYTSTVGLLLHQRKNLLQRLLASAPLRFVGRISYGLYVFHPLVFSGVFFALRGQPAAARAIAGVAATFACALVSWFGMERYLIGLKDKLAPERAKFPESAPPMTAV